MNARVLLCLCLSVSYCSKFKCLIARTYKFKCVDQLLYSGTKTPYKTCTYVKILTFVLPSCILYPVLINSLSWRHSHLRPIPRCPTSRMQSRYLWTCHIKTRQRQYQLFVSAWKTWPKSLVLRKGRAVKTFSALTQTEQKNNLNIEQYLVLPMCNNSSQLWLCMVAIVLSGVGKALTWTTMHWYNTLSKCSLQTNCLNLILHFWFY